MKRTFQRDHLERIKRRQSGYRVLLLALSLNLLLQPLAVELPIINSIGPIALALVILLCLIRNSALQARKQLMFRLGGLAIFSELIWLCTVYLHMPWMLHLAIPRLIIWSLFIGLFLLRMTRALMREPYVTPSVVMGAAAGYLLIGYFGALLLNTLLLWQPEAFNLALLPPAVDPLREPTRTFPALLMASLGSLTTTGTSITLPNQLLGSTASLVIALLGQLYVAVLIALVLGRFRQRRVR
jgi:hypothetical protein